MGTSEKSQYRPHHIAEIPLGQLFAKYRGHYLTTAILAICPLQS